MAGLVPFVVVVMSCSTRDTYVSEDVEGTVVFMVPSIPVAFLCGFWDAENTIDVLFGIGLVELEHAGEL